MFEKKYTRIPKTVYAIQWLPFARLPGVTNLMGEVVQPNFNTALGMQYNPADPFQPPKQPKLTCIGGSVKVGDQEYTLEPHDWVIYSCDNQQPIQVLSEKMFNQIYVDTDTFKLCDACAEAAKKAQEPATISEQPATLQDYVNILRMGKSIIVPTANGSMEFKTEQEFRDYCAKFGKTI